MSLSLFRCIALSVFAVLSAHASAPSVVLSASPSSGAAPLAVLFDGSGSAASGAVSYQWQFGDGGSSTAAAVSHIYNVAGTYTATLVVADSMGNQSPASSVVITVNGTGEGPVTQDMSFRLAPFTSNFKIIRNKPNLPNLNLDSFTFRAAFNSVDLPPSLLNLAAQIKINNSFVVNGVIGNENSFQNPSNLKFPNYYAFINIPDQQIFFQISKANLAAALLLTGATNESVTKSVPVTIAITIGSQTYDFTQSFDYSSILNVSSIGKYDLVKKTGDINEGFFVVNKASAIEVQNTHSHYFEFDGYLARPNNQLVIVPPAGVPSPPTGKWVFTFNEATKITVPIDRFQLKGNLITYTQPDRQKGGIHTVVIDTAKRTFVVTTWDIMSNPNFGGTGLPVRGEQFTAFSFTVRIDLDQYDNGVANAPTVLSAVTATRLTRKSTDDAFWQTGRRAPGK
ncbi:MAG: PKD domain-containing protein [Planctomycetota bacterium]